jgi:hypothetical protein
MEIARRRKRNGGGVRNVTLQPDPLLTIAMTKGREMVHCYAPSIVG